MGTYNIPRNTKGEGRILFIFTPKSLAYTFAGLIIGFIPYKIVAMLGITILKVINIGIFVLLACAGLGFAIATFNVPEIQGLSFTKSTSGYKIDEIIMRAIKFKKKGKTIYVYAKEEKTDE